MFATDFIFNGQRASDFNVVICSFDGEFQVASGGEVELIVVKSPDSDKFTFYGAQYNTVLTWTFSIAKKICSPTEDMYFSQYEERQIAKWLLQRDGYHWFSFIQSENEEDILYNVNITMHPRQIGGRTIGFDLVVTSDSSFGYTPLITKKAIINPNKPLVFYIDTDTKNYLLPVTYITGNGDFYICNENDSTTRHCEFKNMNASTSVMMDSENEIIPGILPDNFNWTFLRLVDGKNTIIVAPINIENGTPLDGDIELEIKYREIRRVVV